MDYYRYSGEFKGAFTPVVGSFGLDQENKRLSSLSSGLICVHRDLLPMKQNL